MGDETRARHEDPRVHAALDALEHRARALGLLERALADLAMGRGSAEGAMEMALERATAMLDEVGWGRLKPTPLLDEVLDQNHAGSWQHLPRSSS